MLRPLRLGDCGIMDAKHSDHVVVLHQKAGYFLMKRRGWVGSLVGIVGLASCSLLAADALAGGVGAKAYPPVVQAAVHAGMTVVRKFPAVSGLTGWVLSRGGRYTLAFTTPDGQSMMMGDLMDQSGRNLTAVYGERYVPKPDYAALFGTLGTTGYITEGPLKHAKSTLYVFFDPNCIYCHLTWKALQPYEKAGLQVRWVPVAFLKPDSAGKAAAILQARNQEAAFRENELRFNTVTEEGGVKPLSEPAAASLARIRDNGQLMEHFGSNGTPTLVWRTRAGAVKVLFGLPKLADLPAITGLPKQRVDDPELARFR